MSGGWRPGDNVQCLFSPVSRCFCLSGLLTQLPQISLLRFSTPFYIHRPAQPLYTNTHLQPLFQQVRREQPLP